MTKKQLRAIIGENIRLERTARNISIEELADMLEITPGFVGLIERGYRGTTPNTLFRLADVFSLSIDSFFRPKEPAGLSFGEGAVLGKAGAKRKKIESMLVNFNEMEMDFIITLLKNLRIMNRANALGMDDDGEVFFDEEDDD